MVNRHPDTNCGAISLGQKSCEFCSSVTTSRRLPTLTPIDGLASFRSGSGPVTQLTWFPALRLPTRKPCLSSTQTSVWSGQEAVVSTNFAARISFKFRSSAPAQLRTSPANSIAQSIGQTACGIGIFTLPGPSNRLRETASISS